MNSLLMRPNISAPDGNIHSLMPQHTGFKYIGFSVFKLNNDAKIIKKFEKFETCIVVITGSIIFFSDGLNGVKIGGRLSPFQDYPGVAYIPPNVEFTIVSIEQSEIALCNAPAKGLFPPRIINQSSMEKLTRGKGSNIRRVCNILPETEQAESLLVVEVITPAGNSSSYPPHKHDQDNLPYESLLEETYYHRINPPQGFGFQRVYTDDRLIDESICFHDTDVVLVPRGYHPVIAPHGYDVYYLNVMAGPKRVWRFQNDKAHEWMLV
jgi:5-deoxy-glucuronate isomerase